MRKQFFYTRKEVVEQVTLAGESREPITKERNDSFNIDAVIRSIEMADGTVLVLLDDIHERTTETPNINIKSNKVTGVVRKRDVYQSEIYLSSEDGLRLKKLTEITE